jgi:hypothetical protein
MTSAQFGSLCSVFREPNADARRTGFPIGRTATAVFKAPAFQTPTAGQLVVDSQARSLWVY